MESVVLIIDDSSTDYDNGANMLIATRIRVRRCGSTQLMNLS